MYKDIDIFDLLTDESKEKIMKELKEAKAEAKKDGLAEGKKAGFLETAKNMLKDGFPIEKIMQITKLSRADIATIRI